MNRQISINEHEAQFFLDALVAESSKLMNLAEKCRKKHQLDAEKGIKKSVLEMASTIKLLSETFELTSAGSK